MPLCAITRQRARAAPAPRPRRARAAPAPRFAARLTAGCRSPSSLAAPPPRPQCPILVWDFEAAVANQARGDGRREGELVHKLVLHKVAVQSIDFSHDTKYLASLGGQDDNTLVIWDLASGRAIVGTPAHSYAALAVSWPHGSNAMLITGGQQHLRKWEFNEERRRLFPADMKLTGVKRVFTAIALTADDKSIYAGTASGDVLLFSADTTNFVTTSSHRFSLGISCLAVLEEEGSLLCGTGDGALVKLGLQDLKFRKAAELMGAVTSIALAADGASAFVGTEAGNIYGVALDKLETQLRGTGHTVPVSDVCFPHGTSDLFLTAGGNDIRVWHTVKRTELLRIQVPNLIVNCIAISNQGTTIVSGWDDGKVRAFSPETGKLQYTINDAHAESVTSVAMTSDGKRLVTGGKDGRVRVWAVGGKGQVMEMSFKEHKKEVTSIRISHNDEECITASADGSCLVWNLRRASRANALFASTVFRTILYHPDESQLLTCGSDRKLSYWDTTDCTAIRVIEGSTEEICSIDIEKEGKLFASGGVDRLVKVWLYDEGEVVASGAGHAGTITKVRISPDNKYLLSVGAEGAIFIWHLPRA